MNDVKRLCEILNASGIKAIPDDYGVPFRCKEWTPDHPLILSLSTIPEDNFNKLMSIEVYNKPNFSFIYQEWGRIGALRFEPFIRKDIKCVMTVRHDRHIQFNHNMYFQAANSLSGLVPYETGSYRMKVLCGFLDKFKRELMSNSLLVNMLWYAGFIDTSFVFYNVRKLFKDNVSVITDFINESMKDYGIEIRHPWDEIQEQIGVNTVWNSVYRNLYKIYENKTLICEFAYGVKTIQVRTRKEDHSAVVLTLKVPHPVIGLTDDQVNSRFANSDFVSDITKPTIGTYDGERVDLKMLLIMMLAIAGIRINWVNCYSLDKFSALNGTNVPRVKRVSSLNDLLDTVPDGY